MFGLPRNRLLTFFEGVLGYSGSRCDRGLSLYRNDGESTGQEHQK